MNHGYAPQAGAVAYPTGYAPANFAYAGYRPYGVTPPTGTPSAGYLASAPSYSAYASPTASASTSTYESEGPPTKKRLTSESQISSAPYSHSAASYTQSSHYTTPSSASHATVSTASSANSSKTSHSTSSSDASAKNDGWPDSLRAYIERCYAITPESDRPELERKLYEMIKLAEQSNAIWTRDWSKMAVPVTSSQRSAPSKEPTAFTFGSKKAGEPQRSKLSKKERAAQQAHSTSQSYQQLQAQQSSGRSNKRGEDELDEEEEEAKRLSRASRFQNDPKKASFSSSSSSHQPSSFGGYGGYVEVSSYEDTEPIVGTSTTLEKPYLRLTERPVPSSVRPLSVLKKSLALMREKKRNGAPWKEYLAGQMQSIRQDIIIQAIADDFALDVYETNARWCLENDDIAEFKRCLLRIDEFYNHLDLTSEHQDEFSCYSLLYHLLPEDFPSLNADLAALAHGRKQLSPAIQHCIRICEAYIDNNWSLFFKLSQTTHFLEKHLLDKAAERIRINSLTTIFVSYVSPNIFDF